ncbi:MAG: alpha/beta fold hydrolase [Suipraeoptans sp.]
MPYFEHQGAQLYYEEIGQGKPLIFLHGASWDMHQWDRQIEHFSSNYRVITLDARGHGKSSLPPGKVSPDIFWQDVIAMMDFLSISKATICGLSMGGHIAIQAAIHAGERVERIILIGTICTNRFNFYERIVLPINRFSLRLMPMSWIAWSLSIGMGNFNSESKLYVRKVVGSLNHDAFNRVWKAVTNMESRDGLSKITCPTLILIGDHDNMTQRQQPYIHEHIQNSKLVTIRNAHHGTNLDNPEQVEKEIEKFLV